MRNNAKIYTCKNVYRKILPLNQEALCLNWSLYLLGQDLDHTEAVCVIFQLQGDLRLHSIDFQSRKHAIALI